jgi:hypothetical protein
VNRGFFQALTVLAITALAACSSNPVNSSLVPQASNALAANASGDVPFLTANPVRALCSTVGDPLRAQCFAMVRTDVVPRLESGAGIGPDAEECPFNEGYCPNDLQAAYKFPSLSNGGGKTVAIVDAYGYHHAASDLAYYRKIMGLKACGTSNKCLRIVNQEGNPSPLPPEPPPSDDWRGEESLDLDMVSAICPNCKIILVQTNNNYTNNLYAGVKTAGRLGPKYIGASWGSGPEGGDNSDFHQPGIVISAAAGDNGGGTKYGGGPIQPCTYTYVVCVGGTHLIRNAHTKRGWTESVWNDFNYDACGSGSQPCGATGSACSLKISKPSWQNDTGCRMRSAADISANASLRSPVIVYNSEIGNCYPSQCFWLFGGTSASTQIISAAYALAGNAAAQMGASYFWKHHGGHVNDVTVGNNVDPAIGVTCASSVHYICYARPGFDGPTGWGSPEGIGGL